MRDSLKARARRLARRFPPQEGVVLRVTIRSPDLPPDKPKVMVVNCQTGETRYEG